MSNNPKSVFLNQYYAFATFMPPGEAKIMMTCDDILDKKSYNFNRFAIPARKEDVCV